MLARDVFQHPGALAAMTFKGVLNDSNGILSGDRNGAILAAGIHHNHIIRHHCRFNTGGNISLLVVSQNKNRKHVVDQRD